MNAKSRIPNSVSAHLDARLAPFSGSGRLGLVNDLKLMFAALGAGNSVIPLGDNSRTAKLLSVYANSLRTH